MLSRRDDAEIENEFVSSVFLVMDADWEPENAILPARISNCDIAVAERLPRDDELGNCFKVYELRILSAFFRYNASWRILMDDFDSWHVSAIKFRTNPMYAWC